jgi:hypothetical protein
MRFLLFSLLIAVLFATVYAVQSQKAVLITYPSDTPASEVDKAIAALKGAGGVVTHEFSTFLQLIHSLLLDGNF